MKTVRNLGRNIGIQLALANIALSVGAPLVAQASVLDRVIERVRAERAEGRQPVVILDLDDTIFDTRSRTLRILREFVAEPEVAEAYPHEAKIIEELELADVHYHIDETMAANSIENAEFVQNASERFNRKYYSNDYLRYDRVVPGALSYVGELIRQGARIVYLTGRNAPGMGPGTMRELAEKRFLFSGTNQVKLLMKPNAKMDDLEFKAKAFEKISKYGVVVGGFENEPRNINAMAKAFPEATMVFLETIHSRHPDKPAPGIHHLRDFRRSVVAER
jgi:hypothetical protein